MEYSATSQIPVYMGHKKGQTKTRREKVHHWSTWEQLSEGDGQGSWCQDVWQTPDGPH